MTLEAETETVFDPTEPLADRVFNNLDQEILHSLSQKQLDAIGEAIAEQARPSRHALELRGLIPLFFANFYYVIQIGRDKRTKYDAIPRQRRQKADRVANILLVVLLSFALLPVLAALLYLIKKGLGINMIPNFHLPDLVKRYFG